MSEKCRRIPPKRLPVTVLHTDTVIVAVHKGRVFRVIRDEQGECRACPFEKLCAKHEKDADTYQPPCCAFGEDVCKFVELVDKQPPTNWGA